MRWEFLCSRNLRLVMPAVGKTWRAGGLRIVLMFSFVDSKETVCS
jgi:hypothetical protein